jgi:hypothetical protein
MSYPGITPITQQSFANGATNPRTDAIQRQADMNQRQTLINQSGQGRGNRRRRYKGGATSNSSVAVPQFQMQYTPTGGPGTNPNDQVAIGAKNGMQASSYSVYDNQATKMGGRRRYRKGGNPDWLWGCYSGGKSRRRNSRKSRKNRKKTRRHSRH